jgi:hypothetical protein
MKLIDRELELDGLPKAVAEAFEPLKLLMRDLGTLFNRGLSADNFANERAVATISPAQRYPLKLRVSAQARPVGVRVVAVVTAGENAALSVAPWIRWEFQPGELSILERPLGLTQGTAYSVRLELEA